MAAPVFVRKTLLITGSNVDSVSGSFSALPAAGNFIGVGVSVFSGSADLPTGCVTDNQGNGSYPRAVRGPVHAINTVSGIFYAENIGSPSGTFTITVDPSGTGNLIEFGAAEFSNMATSASLDKTQTNEGDSSTPTSGTTATTTQADELVLAVLATGNSSSALGIDLPSGFTNITINQDEASTVGHSFDYKIVSATGTQLADWGSVVVSNDPWSGCIATFKAAGGGGATVTYPELERNRRGSSRGVSIGVG